MYRKQPFFRMKSWGATNGERADAQEIRLPQDATDAHARESATFAPWRAWVCLALLLVAELLTIAVPPLGLAVYALLLIGVLAYGAMGWQGPERNLILGLALVPLLRLLSLALPLSTFHRLLWYPLVMLPIMNATRLAARTAGLSREAMGLRVGNLPLQLAAAPVGLGIGVIEYLILRPQPLVAGDTRVMYGLAALTLIIFAGFGEELVFRGLLLPLAQSAMKGWGIVYVSALFAALHVVYRSPAEVLLMFAFSVLLALFASKSRSILGVSLAHGLANVTLFLVMPEIEHEPFFGIAVAALLGCSVVALAWATWSVYRLGPVEKAPVETSADAGATGPEAQQPPPPPDLDRSPVSGVWTQATDLQSDEHADKREEER